MAEKEKVCTRGQLVKEEPVEKFLVGVLEVTMSDRQLPLKKDVLKYILYRKHHHEKNTKQKPCLTEIVCCPLTVDFQASCFISGCSAPDAQSFRCVLACLKLPWINSGIPIRFDTSIR